MQRSISIVAAVLGTAALTCPQIACGQTILNLDGVDDCSGLSGGQSVVLSAGTYVATAIGPAEGGSFLSWNAWGGAVSGCGPDGFGCVTGWWTLFSASGAGADVTSLGGAVIASTEAGGLVNRHRVMVRLCEEGAVRFTIPDGPAAACGDNLGGVSIRVDPGCEADLDADGALSVFDFLAFQNLFDAGSLAADFDCDRALTIFDFLAFQNAFTAGCP